MAVRQFDPMAELTASFQLLTKNWMLAAPLLAVTIVVVIIIFVMGGASLLTMGGAGLLANNNPDAAGGAFLAGLGGLFASLGVAIAVGALLGIVANAATCAAADDAWNGRPVDLSAAIGRGLAAFLNVLVFCIIVAIPCIILGITFVGPIVIAVLMMYGIPAIVIGGQNGIGAIGESYRVVTKNFGPSAMAILGIIAAAVVTFIINAILGHIPIAGLIISAILNALVSAFAAIVLVRFYALLRGNASPMISTPAPPPMVPPSAS